MIRLTKSIKLLPIIIANKFAIKIKNRPSLSKLTVFLALLTCSGVAFGQSHFITTWKTNNPGSSNANSIRISTLGAGYNYDVDVNNDGVFDVLGVTGDFTHNFGSPGTYTIRIRGNFPRIYFNNAFDRLKLLNINNWGNIAWQSMERAFYGCGNLQISATDVPNLSNVTNMEDMFRECYNLNSPSNINNWNVSNVTNMNGVFRAAQSFNQNIAGWNVSNVTNMSNMFRSAYLFDQNISSWNVSKVVNMNNMFNAAFAFNQNINAWNVSNVTEMIETFREATSFNQNISGWNVSKVVNMTGMFQDAKVFNQNISSWNTSKVENMTNLFYGASSFNQNINAWDVSSVTIMNGTFRAATSFNQNISGWNVSNVVDMSSMFRNANTFNQNIGGWNVSKVTNMSDMFNTATNFNQNIGTWNVGNVTNMANMFNLAVNFNQNIGTWNVSKVTNMSNMFYFASNFNQNINSWNVSNVTNMSNMFQAATQFNQPVNNWSVNKVTNMTNMFYNARKFNQALNNWVFHPNAVLIDMLYLSDLDCLNYSTALISWSSNPSIPNNRNLGQTGGLRYGTNAAADRNKLIVNKGWTILGDIASSTFCSNEFITIWDLTKPGGPNTEISFGVATSGSASYTWETIPAGSTGSGTLTGPTATITGLPAGATIRLFIQPSNFQRFIMNNGVYRQRLVNVEQWGVINWTSMQNAFNGCNNLQVSAIDIPRLSGVSDMSQMFLGCTILNSPDNIAEWSTSTISNMSSMFQNASAFNKDLGPWILNNSVNLNSMLNSSGLDCENYSSTLIGWARNNPTVNGRTLGATGRQYGSNAIPSRNILTSTRGWTITGDAGTGVFCPNQFSTRWDLTIAGSGDNQIQFNATVGTGGATYTWKEISPGSSSGSGTLSAGTSLRTIPDLPLGSVVQLLITPTNLQRFFINNGTDRQRLMDVENWSSANWTSMQNAFYGCDNLEVSAFDVPNLTSVTNMNQMFMNCAKLTTPANINTWNTSNVTDMGSLFRGATKFNQNLNSWNTSKVTDMRFMFQNASSFNRSLGNWTLSATVNMANMLDNSGLNCVNYSSTLTGWRSNNPTVINRTLGALGLQYNTSAAAARTALRTTQNWNIIGDKDSDNKIVINLSSCNPSDTATKVQIFAAKNGCDSIVTTKTALKPSYAITIDSTTCNAAQVGTKFRNLIAKNGCDSIITIRKTLLPGKTGTFTNSICQGSGYSITIGGKTFNQATPTGTATVPAKNGCDSVITVTLTFKPNKTGTFSNTACIGSGYSITIGGKTFNQATPTGTATIPAKNGCDSVITVTLSFLNNKTGTFTNTACQGSGYNITIGGTTFNQATPTGTATIPAKNGCDSVITVSLTFLSNKTGNFSNTVCQGSGYSITVGSTIFNQGNPTGTSTVPSKAGCDSIVTVNLTFLPNKASTFTNTACQGSGYSITLGSTTFDQGNPTGTATIPSAAGCDSLITVTLTFLPNKTGTFNNTVCQGSGYVITLGSTTFNEGNPTGSVTIPAENGCDSVVSVTLTFLPNKTGTFTNTACQASGYSITIGSTTFNSSNPTGTAIIPANNGCDSVISVNLSFITTKTGEFSNTSCEGSGYSITIGSTTFNESNPSGTSTIPSIAGCDSIITVSLTFLPNKASTFNNTACQGSGYIVTIGSTTFNEDNTTGIVTIPSSAGCDSVISVSLTFFPNKSATFIDTICQGSGYSITIGSTTFNESNPSGVVTIPSSKGCDSTITVSLTFLPNKTGSFSNTACLGSGYSITIGNTTFNENNQTGSVTIPATNGCDSIITVSLSFLINKTGTFSNTTCQESGYSITIGNSTFNQNNPTGTAIIPSAIGCDSIIAVTLTFIPNKTETFSNISCEGSGYNTTIGGTTFNENNPTGSVTIPSSAGCDSTISVSLSFLPNKTATFSNSACEGSGYNITIGGTTFDEENQSGTVTIPSSAGCDSTISVLLSFLPNRTGTFNNTVCQGSGYSITIGNSTFNENNQNGTATIPANNGCDSVITVALTFLPNKTGTFSNTACEGSGYSITIGNTTFNESNQTGTTTIPANNGCDSVITVSLTFKQRFEITINKTSCNPDNVGTEVLELTTVNGCDSIVEIVTIFQANPGSIINAIIPFGESYTLPNGQEVSDTGTYEVLLTSFEGCDSLVTVFVNYDPNEILLKMPNTFTPNGDGFNDAYRTFTKFPFETFEMRIFDKWGELVFLTNDINEGWDGSFRGKPMNNGAFFGQFRVTFPNNPKPVDYSQVIKLVR